MHQYVAAKTNLAMKTICSIRNPIFFTPQRSQDGSIVKWLLELRGKGRGQGNGFDDDDEMDTDHGRLQARPRVTDAGAEWEEAPDNAETVQTLKVSALPPQQTNALNIQSVLV